MLQAATRTLQLEPFVLREQARDLGVDLLLFGEVRKFVTTLDQLLDLLLDDLLFCLGLFLFRDVIFVVHQSKYGTRNAEFVVRGYHVIGLPQTTTAMIN